MNVVVVGSDEDWLARHKGERSRRLRQRLRYSTPWLSLLSQHPPSSAMPSPKFSMFLERSSRTFRMFLIRSSRIFASIQLADLFCARPGRLDSHTSSELSTPALRLHVWTLSALLSTALSLSPRSSLSVGSTPQSRCWIVVLRQRHRSARARGLLKRGSLELTRFQSLQVPVSDSCSDSLLFFLHLAVPPIARRPTSGLSADLGALLCRSAVTAAHS